MICPSLAACGDAVPPTPEPSPAEPEGKTEPETKGSSVAATVDAAVGDARAQARRTAPPAPVRGVAVGSFAACAWLVDDRVMCWGSDAGGSIGDGSEIGDTPEERVRPYPVPVVGLPRGLQRFDMGWAITRDGTTMVWSSVLWLLDAGDTYYEHRTSAAPWTLSPEGAVDLALASDLGCALTKAGQVWCAGSYETLGDGSKSSRAKLGPVPLPGRAVAMSAGGARVCAVLDDGRVLCWGRDVAAPKDPAPLGCDAAIAGLPTAAPPAEPPSAPTQMVDPCAPRVHVDLSPVVIAGVAEAIDVEVGDDGWACAIVRGGGVACWGHGDQGELGDGTNDIRLDARAVAGLRGPVVQLSGSHNRVCARHEAGTVDCWGTGHTPVTNRPLPVPVIDDAIDLSVGANEVCVARKHDGNAWCWGWLEVGFGDALDRPYELPAPLHWGKP